MNAQTIDATAGVEDAASRGRTVSHGGKRVVWRQAKGDNGKDTNVHEGMLPWFPSCNFVSFVVKAFAAYRQRFRRGHKPLHESNFLPRQMKTSICCSSA